ncbi:5-hydroxytryptamine receptor 1 [Pseudolycoriella hygida]|uniref:5-hydroxytryptamine receptor 1 n=1 Tax=Pseudolycoriella hygida TaxID=35572 RepID=A0A9Q0MWS9_9DIPT|nr:5-hydroxytryptamine receptor 1 [Pseudolycoriella hygida]
MRMRKLVPKTWIWITTYVKFPHMHMDMLSQLIYDEPNNQIDNENISVATLADRVAYNLSTIAPTNIITPGSTTNTAIARGVGSLNGTTISTLPTVEGIIISILLLIVIFGTVIGNILVCVAVCLVRKLRRPCNYLLVSLAVSDLCVAVLVMPSAMLYEVMGRWNFGDILCNIWVAFDVLSCTASILNLCAISLDRFWAITKPLEYGVKRTPRRMMLCVVLVWLGAACISLPPLLILSNIHETDAGVPICVVCQNFAYQIYATLGSFYIPLAVMLFVYYQIFRAARRIVMDEKRAHTHLENPINDVPMGKSSKSNGTSNKKRKRTKLANERKASTTLGIIMSAFIICWLPFFILALVRPFLGEQYQIPPTLSSVFLWLGYLNSMLNPIIYATLNKDFRKPFREMLCFRCSRMNVMMRKDVYRDLYGEPSQRFMLGSEGAGESFL